MVRIAPAALALFLGPSVVGAAQQTTFVGTVTDSLTRMPMPGVSVVLVERQIETSTNTEGFFHLDGIEPGLNTVLVRHPGYEPWAIRLRVRVLQEVDVDIGPVILTPVNVAFLDPVFVEGEIDDSWLHGFNHRMRTEKGTFITAEDIDRLQPRRTSDLLRTVYGFKTDRTGDVASVRGVFSLLDPSACAVDYYINGIHSGMNSLDHIIPTAIAGMEIYRGPSTTPMIFQGTGNNRCGVIAIWTKHGVPNP